MLLIRTLQFAAFLVLCSQCESKLITSLPGLDSEVGFKQYSDYITVGDTNEKRLFYWYMESQSDPATDPLVLWLNGGPGCSSMSGVLGEIGPFYVRPNITLGINKYSWNRVVNLLFVDSPAGIGFSKSGVHNCSTGDVQTTRDLFTFLIKFFESFPHLKSHDFWITGESYAGHYIPNLAQWIVQHNTAKDFSFQHIKLKGFLIGNPLTNAYVDTGGYVDFVFSHQLISNQTYHELLKHCNFSSSSGTAQ
uniref:Carboxypeptidase n=1 Tax=Ciona savignyi TaxID=51511 RepID=H2Y6L0_CIOSA